MNELPRPRAYLDFALRGRHLLVLDSFLVVLSYVAALALRFDAPSALFERYLRDYLWVLPILVVVRLAGFVRLGLYQRVWRYASVAELQAIVLAVTATSVAAYAAVYVLGALDQRLGGLPRSIPPVDSLLLLALIGGARFAFLILRVGRQGGGAAGVARALVVGAGGAGVTVVRQCQSERSLGLHVVGFVDDAESQGHRILGIPVLGRISELQSIIKRSGAGTVLFALPSADGPTLRRLVRLAERAGARSLTVPSLSEVVAGQVSSGLREVSVDDLLRRAPAKIDLEAVRGQLQGRSVLITGAGGSIGGELARQIVRYEPRELYLLGRGENSMYDVLEALRNVETSARLVPVIADIRDEAALLRTVERARPDAVFHAAAHKHVSFMEMYPAEAVATNVAGTLNVLNACDRHSVPRLVFVSSDKAVRPTSVMGATKRVGELVVRDAAHRLGRPYVVVRFGNVLSSRGSVLPRFQRQLAERGPITVTHPQARRYFMTMAEAVQLILQAFAMGKDGETFVLDMGEPVLIEDLARDLIELHGLVPGTDVQIVHTGLLPGEKLTEELFLPEERPERTAHEALWSAEDPRGTMLLADRVEHLIRVAATGQREAIIDALQNVVPEYLPAAMVATPSIVEG